MHPYPSAREVIPTQGELFARLALPRALPLLKSGPEDEQQARVGATPVRH